MRNVVFDGGGAVAMINKIWQTDNDKRTMLSTQEHTAVEENITTLIFSSSFEKSDIELFLV